MGKNEMKKRNRKQMKHTTKMYSRTIIDLVEIINAKRVCTQFREYLYL